MIPANRQILSQLGRQDTQGTDKLADKQTDHFENSNRVAIEICHCLMLQPWSFGGSFKSHYANYRFMTRGPGANFNSTQAGMDCGFIVPEAHVHLHAQARVSRLPEHEPSQTPSL